MAGCIDVLYIQRSRVPQRATQGLFAFKDLPLGRQVPSFENFSGYLVVSRSRWSPLRGWSSAQGLRRRDGVHCPISFVMENCCLKQLEI